MLCCCRLAGLYDRSVNHNRVTPTVSDTVRALGGRRSYHSTAHTTGIVHPSCSANAAPLSGRQHASPSPYQPFWLLLHEPTQAFLLNEASSRIRVSGLVCKFVRGQGCCWDQALGSAR